MKKRILSLCMVLALCLGLLPATALAADGDTVYVGGVALTGSTGSPAYATTDTSGNVSSGGNESNYNIKWDGSTLTLKNAYINGGVSDSASYITGAGIGVLNISGNAELAIQLDGSNTVSASNGVHVYTNSGAASLTITGGGSLDASGYLYGIRVQSNSGDATLNIQGAVVEATVSGASGDGVLVQAGGSSNASLSVDGGNLTATGTGFGSGINFQFGNRVSGSGTPSLNVSGSAIVKASGGNGGIASNSSPVTPSGAGIVFDNGTGTVYGNVTLQENLEIGEDESLTIPDGAGLTVPADVTLTNKGEVTTTGSGTLTNNGTINNSGTLPDNIGGTAPPSITTTSLDGGTVRAAYTATLTASGNPTSWKITEGSLPAGLTLDENTGVISGTPTAQGTSNFTVTAANSGGSDSEQLSITIDAQTNVPVTGVSLNTNTLNLIEGDTDTLTATVEPNNATDQNVTWSSDNESVAMVNNGVVTAVGAGTATITVTTEDGNKTATCAVTVTARTYNISANPATLDFGSVNAGYTAAPAEQTVTITNTGNQSVTVNLPTSTNYTIMAGTGFTNGTAALVPNSTAQFTVQPRADLAIGTYNETIVISGSDGAGTSLTAGFAVSAIPVSGVSLNTSTLRLTEGDTDTLTATVEPDNATNKNVTWSSDNESVATVNDGVVTAVAAGTATITVTTEDGSKTATCVVTVTHGSLTHTPGNVATCTEDGNEEYWTCETCGKHFSDAGGNTEITLEQTVIPATDHSYGEPVWSWSEDGKSCTVTFICANDETHRATPEVTITSEVKTAASCTEKGVTEYTATAEFDGITYTDTRDVADIPVTDHHYENGRCSVCRAIDSSFKPVITAGQNGSVNKDSNNPQTGDDSSMMLWLLILAVSGCAVMRVFVYNKRKKC